MDTGDICLNNGYKGDIKSFLILSKKNDLSYVTAAPQIQMKNIDSVSIYFNGKNYSLSHMMTVQKKYLGKVIDRIDEAMEKEIANKIIPTFNFVKSKIDLIMSNGGRKNKKPLPIHK